MGSMAEEGGLTTPQVGLLVPSAGGGPCPLPVSRVNPMAPASKAGDLAVKWTPTHLPHIGGWSSGSRTSLSTTEDTASRSQTSSPVAWRAVQGKEQSPSRKIPPHPCPVSMLRYHIRQNAETPTAATPPGH